MSGFRDKFQRQVDFYLSDDRRRKSLETILNQTSPQELLRLAQNGDIETLALPELTNEEVARLLERAMELGFGNDVRSAARASQLLLKAYDAIEQLERALPYRKKCIELLKA